MKISKYRPIRSFLKGQKHFAGRNNRGHLTVRHQGGGHKQSYRQIDWNRSNTTGTVVNFEYDPNRTAYIAKINHNVDSKEKSAYSYIIAPKGLKVFDKINTVIEKKKNLYLRPGDASVLSNFEPGDFVHNVELIPNQGASLARSAGTFCQVLQHTENYVKLRMPSGSERLVPNTCKATLGVVSNDQHIHKNLLKAGRSRWMNVRPSVRGVAMNPVDHPHGGGQGKTKGGRPSVTPWSRPTKGQPTRNKRKKNPLIVKLKKNKANI